MHKIYIFFVVFHAWSVLALAQKEISSSQLDSAKYPLQKSPTHDTIPFELTANNNIKIKTVLNEVDTLDLYFDSGGTELVVAHDAISDKTNLLDNKPNGFEAKDYEPISSDNSLSIGKTKWTDLTLYPVTLRGQGTDGSFGWNLFDGQIVELDYEKSLLIIHSSLDDIPLGYAKLKMEFINTLFCVQGTILNNGKKYNNRYLFDTGYQRAIVLDSVLLEKQLFPKDLPVIKTTSLRNGRGEVFYTNIINLEKLMLGSSSVLNVPSQVLTLPNPARFETHILGNELLKRFNTFLDFQNNFVYLRPNQLMSLTYKDAS